ncbi:MAG: hypothetical protein AAFX86_06205 [Pseudomonadota bacterium]
MVSVQAMTFDGAAPGTQSLWERPAGAISWRIWTLWLMAFGAFSIILPRDASYDVLHYHLYNGWAVLNAPEGQHFAPAEMHSFLNPMWQAVIWQLIEWLPGVVVAFILGALQALVLPALYALTRRALLAAGHMPKLVTVLAVAVCGFLCEAQFGLVASVRNDALSALVFIAALLALFPAQTARRQLAYLALASAGLGLILGLKPTNGVYVAGFAVAALIAAPNWAFRAQTALVCGIAGAIGIALGGGYWMAHLWETFGNPLFPMANDVFNAELGPQGGFRDTRYLPDGVFDAIIRPFAFLLNGELITEHDFFDPRFQMAYLAAPVVAYFAWRARRPEARSLIGFSAAILVTIAAWSAVFSIARYAAAIWMLGPTALVVAVALVRPNWMTAPKTPMYGLVLAILIIATTQPATLRRVPMAGVFAPYVSVSVPETESYENAVIAFSGGYPAAFTAYAFPESATFTHLVPQDWSAPALEPYRNARIRPLLAQDKPIYAVIVDTEDHFEETAEKLLRVEGLIIDAATCKRLHTDMDSEAVLWRICPLGSANGRP